MKQRVNALDIKYILTYISRYKFLFQSVSETLKFTSALSCPEFFNIILFTVPFPLSISSITPLGLTLSISLLIYYLLTYSILYYSLFPLSISSITGFNFIQIIIYLPTFCGLFFNGLCHSLFYSPSVYLLLSLKFVS